MTEDYEKDWEDYYQILGVDQSASLKEMKEAYYDKCHIFHPDRLTRDSAKRIAEEEMKKLHRAYAVLNDTQQRKRYHESWLQKQSTAAGAGQRRSTARSKVNSLKPKPFVYPRSLSFDNVMPQDMRIGSFVVKNEGGPYNKIQILVANSSSPIKVASYKSLNTLDELPLEVNIEGRGGDWGKRYEEDIIVKLDNEETRVRVSLTSASAESADAGSKVPGYFFQGFRVLRRTLIFIIEQIKFLFAVLSPFVLRGIKSTAKFSVRVMRIIFLVTVFLAGKLKNSFTLIFQKSLSKKKQSGRPKY